MTYETKQVAPAQPILGSLPMLSQRRPAEGRVPGLMLECSLCEPEVRDTGATWLHPIDSRSEVRGAIYGSDERFVVNVLLGCEHGGHYVILEITNLKGSLNMGMRTPYDRELVSEWVSGTFDNPVFTRSVRFNENFEVSA